MSARSELLNSIEVYLEQSSNISNAIRAENLLSLVEAQDNKYRLKYLQLLRDIMYLHKELVCTSADSELWYEFLRTAGYIITDSILSHTGDEK